MRMKHLLLTALVLAATACSKDDSSTGTTTPTTPLPGTSSNGQSIALDSTADAQSLVVASALPVRVRVAQAGGGAAANVPVTWKIVTGHGKLSDSTTTTNSAGLATITWTLGDTAGA